MATTNYIMDFNQDHYSTVPPPIVKPCWEDYGYLIGVPAPWLRWQPYGLGDWKLVGQLVGPHVGFQIYSVIRLLSWSSSMIIWSPLE